MKLTKEKLLTFLESRFVSLKDEYGFDNDNGFAQVEKSSEQRKLHYFRFRAIEHVILTIRDGDMRIDGNTLRFSKSSVINYLTHYVDSYSKMNDKINLSTEHLTEMRKYEVSGSLSEYKHLLDTIKSGIE